LAGTAITLVLVFWGFLHYRSVDPVARPGGSFPDLYKFAPRDDRTYAEIWGEQAGKKTRYRREKSATGQPEYRDEAKKRMPARVDAIIVKEDGQDVRFEAERDEKGNFKKATGQPLRYLDPSGRAMSEEFPGEISLFRGGAFFGYVLLNLLQLAVWFAAFWLILRFQWSHALGLAVIFWAVATLVLMPMILGRVEIAARERKQPASASARGPG
jgi:hypothetical protein